MKGKARSLLLLLITALFTIGMPSCDGPDYVAIRGIQTADFFDVTSNNFIPAPAVISKDSMVIVIQPRVEFFTQFSFQGTMDQAWAFSPADPIMANEITDIRITSNKDIYDVPAGQNLSHVLQFSAWPDSKFSLSEFLEDYLEKGSEFYFNESIFVFFNGKPTPDTYQFVVEMEDNNGHVFTATTTQLTWQ